MTFSFNSNASASSKNNNFDTPGDVEIDILASDADALRPESAGEDHMNIEEQGQDQDAGAVVETVANFELPPGDDFDATSCDGDVTAGSVAAANRPWNKQSMFRAGALTVLLASTVAVAGTGIAAWQQNNNKRIDMHQSSVVATAKSLKQPKSKGSPTLLVVWKDSLNLVIPDSDPLNPAEVNIDVTWDCVIQDVDNVRVDIAHTRAADLIMTLTSPDGVTAGLLEGNGGSTALIQGTPITFDDASDNSPTNIGSLYPGVTTFKSSGAPNNLPFQAPKGTAKLTDMNGGSTSGNWKFRVGDGNCGAVGTLYSVQIIIQCAE